MKIDNDSNSENKKKTGFFGDRPNVGLGSNKMATMRSIILLAKSETDEEVEPEVSSQYSI